MTYGLMMREYKEGRTPPQAPYKEQARVLCDGDFGAKVDVLDGVEELDAFLHGALEGFAAGDKARTAGALVDDGGGDGFLEGISAGCSAAVDQAGAAHVAVGDLIAGPADGMIAGKVGVNALVELAIAGIAHVEGLIAAAILPDR